jgi:hypothetical protein
MTSDLPNLELLPCPLPYHPRTPIEGGVRQGIAGGAVVVPNLKYGSTADDKSRSLARSGLAGWRT